MASCSLYESALQVRGNPLQHFINPCPIPFSHEKHPDTADLCDPFPSHSMCDCSHAYVVTRESAVFNVCLVRNVCVCMYVCMCMCVYVCMYVCMYVCVCMCVCVYVCVCMSACMCVCVCVCVCVCKRVRASMCRWQEERIGW